MSADWFNVQNCCEMQDAGYRMQDTRCRIRDAG